MTNRGLAVAVAIVAALVVLSILASVRFVKPCARGEGEARIGGMLVAGCGFDR
jgi:hypothetical protein